MVHVVIFLKYVKTGWGWEKRVEDPASYYPYYDNNNSIHNKKSFYSYNQFHSSLTFLYGKDRYVS